MSKKNKKTNLRTFYVLKGNDFIKKELIDIKMNDRFTFTEPDGTLKPLLFKACCHGGYSKINSQLVKVKEKEIRVIRNDFKPWENLRKNINKHSKSNR